MGCLQSNGSMEAVQIVMEDGGKGGVAVLMKTVRLANQQQLHAIWLQDGLYTSKLSTQKCFASEALS
eukprot:2696186-Ditylum_brightwellii.AAC.1